MMGAESESLSWVAVYLPRKVNIRLTLQRTDNPCSSIHVDLVEKEKKSSMRFVENEMGVVHMMKRRRN